MNEEERSLDDEYDELVVDVEEILPLRLLCDMRCVRFVVSGKLLLEEELGGVFSHKLLNFEKISDFEEALLVSVFFILFKSFKVVKTFVVKKKEEKKSDGKGLSGRLPYLVMS